jgi:hypothetical protein
MTVTSLWFDEHTGQVETPAVRGGTGKRFALSVISLGLKPNVSFTMALTYLGFRLPLGRRLYLWCGLST